MKNTWSCILLLAVLLPKTSFAEVFVLSAGSNKSVDQRSKILDYAALDADAFAKTMKEVGAVSEKRVVLSKNPSLEEFESQLKSIAKAMSHHVDTVGNKFVFFFSGHADERGLHFKDGFYSKNSLDSFLKQLQVKTKVLIIDSCFAGIMSSKGIKPVEGVGSPKLNFDEPSGSIFLTASSDSELAFESRKLKGGLFTSNIVGGLTGKADSNSDGVVTATELYEYAFRETQLSSRLLPIPGVQSPEFVADLKGRGSVALSFPSKARGQVRMTPDLKGSIKLYAAKGIGTFEHMKDLGQTDTINLPAGDYKLEVNDSGKMGTASLQVPPKAVALLTKHDIEWNKPVDVNAEIKSRGVSSFSTNKKSAGVALGTLSGNELFFAELSLMGQNSSGWDWPRLAFGGGSRVNHSGVSGADAYREDLKYSDIENVSNQYSIIDFFEMKLGVGIPLFSIHNAYKVKFLPELGISSLRVQNAPRSESIRNMQVLMGQANVIVPLYKDTVGLGFGYRKLIAPLSNEYKLYSEEPLSVRIDTRYDIL